MISHTDYFQVQFARRYEKAFEVERLSRVVTAFYAQELVYSKTTNYGHHRNVHEFARDAKRPLGVKYTYDTPYMSMIFQLGLDPEGRMSRMYESDLPEFVRSAMDELWAAVLADLKRQVEADARFHADSESPWSSLICPADLGLE